VALLPDPAVTGTNEVPILEESSLVTEDLKGRQSATAQQVWSRSSVAQRRRPTRRTRRQFLAGQVILAH
jgi:hypothetical protein